MTSSDSEPGDIQACRARVKRLAWLFDESIGIPGTRISLGLDSIVGLIPGVGDLLGVLLGLTVIHEGIRAEAPRPLLLKMARNSLIDLLGGLVPVVGDLFDVAFKANSRNARILLDFLDERERESQAPLVDRGRGPAIGLGIVAILASAALIGTVVLTLA